MIKILYFQPTQQIYPYPRNDDLPIVGLSPEYLELAEVFIDPPSYNPQTQSVVSSWEVDVSALEYRQAWTIIDNPPVPDWDGFNLTFTLLPSLLQAEVTANQNHPSITGKKDDAYAMIDTHGVGAFGLIFPLFCQAGQVSTETRIEWATLAESFNMPQDFIDIIRGP